MKLTPPFFAGFCCWLPAVEIDSVVVVVCFDRHSMPEKNSCALRSEPSPAHSDIRRNFRPRVRICLTQMVPRSGRDIWQSCLQGFWHLALTCVHRFVSWLCVWLFHLPPILRDKTFVPGVRICLTNIGPRSGSDIWQSKVSRALISHLHFSSWLCVLALRNIAKSWRKTFIKPLRGVRSLGGSAERSRTRFLIFIPKSLAMCRCPQKQRNSKTTRDKFSNICIRIRLDILLYFCILSYFKTFRLCYFYTFIFLHCYVLIPLYLYILYVLYLYTVISLYLYVFESLYLNAFVPLYLYAFISLRLYGFKILYLYTSIIVCLSTIIPLYCYTSRILYYYTIVPFYYYIVTRFTLKLLDSHILIHDSMLVKYSCILSII